MQQAVAAARDEAVLVRRERDDSRRRVENLESGGENQPTPRSQKVTPNSAMPCEQSFQRDDRIWSL